MQPMTMSDLSVGLVPREQFGRRRWFFATPKWYYHRPGALPKLNTDDDFYKLIDPDLREVCAQLHRHGILTAPSCQGHFHQPPYFVEVWEELQSQADLIRGHGLEVEDSETKGHVLFQNRDYDLPWSNFNRFFSDLSLTQNGGYLGIAVQDRQRWLWDALYRLNVREKHVRLELDCPQGDENWLIHLYVDAPNPDRQSDAWRQITHHVDQLLRHPTAPGPVVFDHISPPLPRMP